MKQTAVDWLVEKLEIFATEQEMNIIEQAKAMEKEQIMNAYKADTYFGSSEDVDAEQYYKQTFKSKI